MTREEFISKYSADAIKVCEGTHLYPSLMLAQAALESNNGNSYLTVKANNFFGIKVSKGWTGDYITLNTREVIMGKEVIVPARFRKYANAQAAFRDRNNFLQVNPRYARTGVFAAQTPDDQALALQHAGYATDPNYAGKLIAILTANNLDQYDKAPGPGGEWANVNQNVNTKV